MPVLSVTLLPLVERRRNNLKLWRRPFVFVKLRLHKPNKTIFEETHSHLNVC